MLKADNISFKVSSSQILQDISFAVAPGEMLAIIGANGAGKSTLLKVLCGELKPSTGKVQIQGKELSTWNAHELAKFRAVLQQQTNLSVAFLVKDIVMMGRYPHFKQRANLTDYNIINNALKRTGIEHLQNRNYLTLSGGEQQRVQLARVFAQIWFSEDYDTRYLLMDEPVNSLDIPYQHATLKMAKEYADQGNCVVTVLHDLNMASQYADRILLLKKGKVLAFGKTSQVFTDELLSNVFDFSLKVSQQSGYGYPIVMPVAEPA